MYGRFLGAFLLLDVCLSGATLTSASQIHALTAAQARRGDPVSLKGIVTHAVPEWWGFSLQDSTEGVYVAAGTPDATTLKPGDVVAVEGHAGAGNFAPMVVATTVRVLGEAALPAARPASWETLSTGSCDNDLIEVQGVVRSAGSVKPPAWEWPALAIRLDLGGNLIWAYLRDPAALARDRLVDATVRVEAVCMVLFNERRQFQGSSLAIPSAAQVHLLQPGPADPYSAPLKPIDQVFGFDTNPFHRVKVQGTVTFGSPGRVYIQEGRSGMLVRTAADTAAHPGDRVEAVGFPAAGAFSTVLEDALVRVVGRAAEPAPLDTPASGVIVLQAAKVPATLDALLVRVQAVLVDKAGSAGEQTLLLQDGQTVFNVRLPAEPGRKLASLKTGSRLSVTGVCAVHSGQRGLPRSFELLMRSPSDLRVVAGPPWLTRNLALRAAATLAFGVLAAAVWLFVLRRRVARQTATIRGQFEREQALQLRYRDLIENASDPVYVRDLEGRLLEVNRGMEQLTGYSRDELAGRNIADLLAPGERERAGRELSWRPGAAEPPAQSEWRFLTRDGRERTVEVKNRYLAADGRPARVECIGRDVTERQQAQAEAERGREVLSRAHDELEQRVHERTTELRATERRFRLAVENFPSLFVIYDSERRIRFINERGARLIGIAAEAAHGSRDEDIFPAAVTGCYLPALVRCAAERTPQNVECDLTLPSGAFHLLFTYVPVLDDRGELAQILGIAHDMTERRRLQEQLLHSQKLEAMGLLAGGVAHDFNNMLAVIIGHAQLLLEDMPPGPQREAVDQMLKAAERNAELTRQLLAFSRRQVLEPRVVDLNDIILSLQKMLRRLVRENIELEAAPDPHLGSVRVDPGQMEQILVNLVINARDAMPEGGRIRIATRNQALDAGFVARHPGSQTGDFVVLEVSDTGHGMDSATLARIFEPFFTTKGFGKGSGLGLATVYGIVSQSGGYIDVESAPGRGTAFCVYLPRVSAAPEAAAEPAREIPARGRERILLVEDEASVRALVRDVLQANGYSVVEADDGLRGLDICTGDGGRFDLLITDMVMPNMGGEELAARIAERFPHIRVLFISGYSDAAGNGANHLQKPFRMQTLMRKVREVLDASGPLHSAHGRTS